MISLLDSGKIIGRNVSVRQLARECLPNSRQSPISLRELITTPGCPLSKCLRLHIKRLLILPPMPGAPTPPPPIPIAEMLSAMRIVFKTAGIRVVVGSREELPFLPLLTVLDVGECRGSEVTLEQTELFGNRNHVGEDEIAMYFITSTEPATNGCATHPDGLPSAVVVSTATRWTLAHEVGHVLGLVHIDNDDNCDLTRLMTGCGTGRIVGTPTLSDLEKFKMNLCSSVAEC